MKYCVPIVSRGLSNFLVEANNTEEAKEEAIRQFNNGEIPASCGNEWEEIEQVGEIEEVRQ